MIYPHFKLSFLASGVLAAAFSSAVLAKRPESGVSFTDRSYQLASFERVQSSGSAGVSGVAWLDYDADGDLDLYLPNSAGHASALFNNHNGKFVDVTEKAGLADVNGYMSVVAGDIDNDGYPDLYVGGEGGYASATTPSRLYRNNGDGTFSDISATSNTPGSGAVGALVMADFNNDGLLDIFASGVGHMGLFFPPSFGSRNTLYINNGDLSFEDASATAGVDEDVASCVARAVDHNSDGWMDILVGSCMPFMPDHPMPAFHLYENNKDGTFTDIADKVGLNLVGAWMGISLGDYDNDGDLDIFATNDAILGSSTLLRKNADGRYEDVTSDDPALNLFGWGATFVDFDNDGHLDLFYAGNWQLAGIGGNPGHLLINDGVTGFDASAGALGADLSDAQASGVAAADYNGDGYVDLVIATEAYEAVDPATGEVVMSGEGKPYLFENRGNGNKSLTVRLVGTESNAMAIGARLTLYTGDGMQVRDVVAGSSFASSESPWPTFGMGRSRNGTLKVEWPSGRAELFRVRAGKMRTLREGSGSPTWQ